MFKTSHCNGLRRLHEYFMGESTVGTRGEFFNFWWSLSDEERHYYRSVDLRTGKPCVEQICGVAHIAI
jgi:hypothetical protein